MTKITLTTVKSFIRKHQADLLISSRSTFDGMVDGCRSTGEKEFSPAVGAEYFHSNNMGLAGAWFVFDSRDHFSPYEDDEVSGIEVYNCCGNFILAAKH